MNRKIAGLILASVVAVQLTIDVEAAIPRSAKAVAEFKRQQPCPNKNVPKKSRACTGWVVDHIQPLACGGEDSPRNMQWQTAAEAKAKDKWERKGCQFPGRKD